jgi:hypothetical protein
VTARPAAIARGGLAGLVAIALAVGLGACGVPADSGARMLSSSEMPKALSVIPVATTGPTTPADTGHGFVDVPVFFLFANDSELREVSTAAHQPVTLQTVLQALEDGPTTKEYAEGYTTAIPSNTNFRVIGHSVRGVLHVALDSTYYNLSEPLAILEIAQVVYTLAKAPGGDDRVQFYRNGATAGVLAGDGQFIPGPVSLSNYSSVFTSA